MSLLSLNSPTGRSPRGKKSSRAWMGFGLAIAVLGIGSTFAANININGGQDTEFGQGRTRTVFCGGDEKVTIAPISTYVNRGAVSSGSDEVNFMGRFGTSYIENVSGSYFQHTGAFVTVNGIEGLWLTDVGPGGTKASNQTLENAEINKATYVFSPKATRGSNVGVYKVDTFQSVPVVVTAAVLPNPPTATFRTAGVLISDIPPQCNDVTFVLSFFGATGTAQTMISKDTEDVKEVAYTWYNTIGSGYSVSSSRTSFVGTPLVTAETTADSLKFIFNSAGATAIEADDLDKIVIETQPDSFD